jgi:hypothetical protein
MYRRSASVPDASKVVTRYDLAQPPSFDVSHLNETRVKDKDVWWVPSDVLCSTLPLDGTLSATRVAVAVHIQPELLRKRQRVDAVRVPICALTIVTKKELVLAGAEHAHRTTRLTPFSELLVARVVALRNGNALKTVTARQPPTCKYGIKRS